MKPKPLTEVQFLALLEKVLAKFVERDLKLRAAIQEEVSKEIRLHNHVASFTKFCEQGAVPDLKPETVAELQEQLAATFGSDASVSVTPDESRGGLMDVEITLPDRTVTSQVKVDPAVAAGGEEPVKAPFVPFPVALPTDAELVWVLARREDLGPDEAARALANIEEEYWSSKAGQKRLKDGAERTFAEFIANVPSAALLESGLKRHYKEPETLHSLRLLAGGAGGAGGVGDSGGGGGVSLDALFSDEPPARPRPDRPVAPAEEPAAAKGPHPLSDDASGEDDAPWD